MDRHTDMMRDESIPTRWMAILSTCFMAFAIVVIALTHNSESSGVTFVVGLAAILAMLAGGTYLRLRWTMAVAAIIATGMWVALVITWFSSGHRPALIYILVLPIMAFYNAIAFYCRSRVLEERFRQRRRAASNVAS